MVPALRYVTQVAPYRDGPAGVHGVLDQSALAMAQLAETAGLGFERVFDVRELDPRSFDDTGVLALFTIGETPWSTAQRRSLLESVRAGRTSVLAIHSATDACYGWDDYRLLVGARFDGHPWTQTSTLDVLVPDHPALAHLGATWRWYDEIYRFRFDPRRRCSWPPDPTSSTLPPPRTPNRHSAIPCPGASPRGPGGCSRPLWGISPRHGRASSTYDTWPGD